MVDQVGRRLRHAPRAAQRAEASALAAEGNQFVVPTVAAAQQQEAVGQDAVFKESVELVLHELRQVGASCRLGLLKKVAACCCTSRYSVVCSGRWRS